MFLRRAVGEVVEGESGSTILMVVVALILVFTALVGVVLSLQVQRTRFIQEDVDRAEARYAAEAGVYRALAGLGGDLQRLTMGFRVRGGARCSVRVIPSGGFARVRSTARVRSAKVTVQALGGMRPPQGFDTAVTLAGRSPLTLTGPTEIYGPIQVGRRGLRRASLRGRPFAGTHRGRVERVSNPELPAFDPEAYQRALRRAIRWLRSPPTQIRSIQTPLTQSEQSRRGETWQDQFQQGQFSMRERDSSKRFLSEGLSSKSLSRESSRFGAGRSLITLPEGGRLGTGAQNQFESAVLLIAGGPLQLGGTLELPAGSMVVAERVRIGSGVSVGQSVVVGREKVVVEGRARLRGQLLSYGTIEVRGRARLRHPSVLYASPSHANISAQTPATPTAIQVSGRARVDGLLMVPGSGKKGHTEVRVGKNALVRGAVYNKAQTRLQGTVYGSVLTEEFRFYNPPDTYINWIREGMVYRKRRPDPFVLPFGFEEAPQPVVIRWEEGSSTRDSDEQSRGASRDRP